MAKIKFIVKNQNTLEIIEDAKAGDIIDLKEKMSMDTSALEAFVQSEISSEKDRQFQNKLEAEKKLILLDKEKELQSLEHDLNQKIKDLEAELKMNAELKKKAEEAFLSDKQSALKLKEAEITSRFDKKITELNEIIQSAASNKELSLKEQQMKNQEILANKEKELFELRASKDSLLKEKEQIVSSLKNDFKMQLELQTTKLEMNKKEELQAKELEISSLHQKINEEVKNKEEALRIQKEVYLKELEMKDEQIAQYKDFKTRMSTKMIGESLEQHCLNEFNKVRTYAFPNATFEKDNDASSGSKGDFIYREVDSNGIEILSIMFEMKNEMDTTSTKHKNEDFFDKLDKDRIKKKCEYAVLVTMLEIDNEYYNIGIVDVSYEYKKMYVVRPHMFLTLIGLLRQAAMNAYQYKVQLKEAMDTNVDITNFEGKLTKFKDDFTGHYQQATKNHEEAIKEIDKAIKDLEQVKAKLQNSDRYLELCTKDMEKVTIKKLTYGNPTMKKLLEENKDN